MWTWAAWLSLFWCCTWVSGFAQNRAQHAAIIQLLGSYVACHQGQVYAYLIFVGHICILILFPFFNLYFSASLSAPTISPSLSLMMGVFLFCGGCELSEFVSVSIIPSLWAPAYKSCQGPNAPSHRPPVPAPCLLFHAHTATGKTVDKHLRQGENGGRGGGREGGTLRATITRFNHVNEEVS